MSQATPRPTAARTRKFECNELPAVLRVLFIADRPKTGAWLARSLTTEAAAEIHVDEVQGCASGFDRLRDDSYDLLLVSHQPGEMDAVELIRGYRAGGAREPIVVMGLQSEQEAAVACLGQGADDYVCVSTITTELLLWTIARAVRRHRLSMENQRLERAQQQRLEREHDEADRLLMQQRALIRDLEAIQLESRAAPVVAEDGESATSRLGDPESGYDRDLAEVAPSKPPALPQALCEHYRRLLRTYVIMGSGNLARELSRLAELLITADVSARQTMELHVFVLEELVRGLGSRSTRHVMTRADLLALEIMTHLAEGYRRCYRRRTTPPVQRLLPGFEELESRKAG